MRTYLATRPQRVSTGHIRISRWPTTLYAAEYCVYDTGYPGGKEPRPYIGHSVSVLEQLVFRIGMPRYMPLQDTASCGEQVLGIDGMEL